MPPLYDYGGMSPYDAALLAVIPSPRTIDEVLPGMQAMDALFTDGDGLRWFHRLYLEVTQAVATRTSSGGFTNSAWLAALDVQFANLYFDALRAYLSGGRASGCWSAMFDRRTDAAVARIQFALAGMNAHINHDLPLAIVATCRETSVVPRHGSPEYADYTSVNSTLNTLIDRAKQELMVRLLGDPLPPISHLEDRLAAWGLASARESAWTNAEVLWGIGAVSPLATRFEDTLDGLASLAGKTLMVPVPLAAVQAA